jgi:hypothetical protein
MKEGAVVKGLVDGCVQYAVIEGLQTETGHERFVIAYPNEQSLRDLIAAPSIVAFGFSSREEAVAGSGAGVPTAVPWLRTPEAVAGGENQRHPQELCWAQRREETLSALRRLGRLVATSCSDVVTLASVIFSSGSFFAAAIRVALGSSV